VYKWGDDVDQVLVRDTRQQGITRALDVGANGRVEQEYAQKHVDVATEHC
jgi:hypothetical protein